ncbi:MAG: heat-inducible transcriptional repressor HrcA [Candidatus Neomarinimicrobiota bacterium]
MELFQQTHLNERQETILRIVIESFIETNRPVGSSYISSNYPLSLSSATIRSCLASLEKTGLLTNLHISSGRIPTDAGYRYYVDKLLTSDNSSRRLEPAIYNQLKEMSDNIENLMQATAITLAKVCQMFGIVVISGVNDSVITEIEAFSLSSDRVMIVIALRSGLVKSIALNLHIDVVPTDIEELNITLKERIVGFTLKEIQNTIRGRLSNTPIFDHEIVQIILNQADSIFKIAEETLIYTSSYNELLNYPEFQDIKILKRTITGLQENNIREYLIPPTDSENINTIIGHENKIDNLQHCSVLSSSFLGATYSGRLAVLGPTRVPYKQVKSLLKYFVEMLPNVY